MWRVEKEQRKDGGLTIKPVGVKMDGLFPHFNATRERFGLSTF